MKDEIHGNDSSPIHAPCVPVSNALISHEQIIYIDLLLIHDKIARYHQSRHWPEEDAVTSKYRDEDCCSVHQAPWIACNFHHGCDLKPSPDFDVSRKSCNKIKAAT